MYTNDLKKSQELAASLTKTGKWFLLQLPSVLAFISVVLFLFLPIVKVNTVKSVEFKLFGANDYNIDIVKPIIYCVFILLTCVGFEFGLNMIRKNKTVVAIVMSFVFAVIALVFTLLLTFYCNDVFLMFRIAFGRFAERGIVVMLMQIGGYLAAIDNLIFGIVIAVIYTRKAK